MQIYIFIISILKSLAIPAIWLALSNVINLQIKLFFAVNRIIHVLKRFISFLNRTIFCSTSHHFCFEDKMDVKAFLFPLFNKPATWSIGKILLLTEFCDFKMAVVSGNWLNFTSCNFGLKSYLRFQGPNCTPLSLRVRKSKTVLDSRFHPMEPPQFNYHHLPFNV